MSLGCRTRRALAVLALATLSLTTGPAVTAGAADHRPRCRPGVRALADLGTYSQVTASNRHGVYVGGVGGADGREQAAYWEDDRLQLIGPSRFPGLDSQALDVNDSGAILGGTYFDEDTYWVFDEGRVHRLAGLGGPVYATAINDDGVVVGLTSELHGVVEAVRWTDWDGAPEVLGRVDPDTASEALGINDGGRVVGLRTPSGPSDPHPVTWSPRGRLRDLPTDPAHGLTRGLAAAINRRGQIAGGLRGTNPAGPWSATRWSGGRLVTIGNLPGDDDTVGQAIADNGWVVGRSNRAGPDGPVARHAFLWTGRGPITALPPLGGSWATSQSLATDVDSRGTVVGYSTDGAGRTRATVWTCADRQAFVPPATIVPATSSPIVEPRSVRGR